MDSSRKKSTYTYSRLVEPSSSSHTASPHKKAGFGRAVIIDARKYNTKEINSKIKRLASREKTQIMIRNPGARHNLVVGVVRPCRIAFDGGVGYYCCSFCDGIDVSIDGNSGWGLGDNLMSGRLRVKGDAGACLGASMHGGNVLVEGDAGARAGILMKGGTIVVLGSTGFLTGFMMQKGKMVVLGDVGDAAGDSMYEGVIYVGGKISSLGADARIETATPEENEMIMAMLENWGLGNRINQVANGVFKKIMSAKRLYHYDALEPLEKERMVI